MLGMIIALDHSKFMKEKDVVDLFTQIQSFHNDEYMKFLAILSILLFILGFIAVFITNRRIAATEKRLDNKIIEFDNKINEKIETKIKEELEKQVINYRVEFDEKLRNSIEKISNEKDYSLNILKAHNYMNIFKYAEAYNKLVLAAEMALKVNNKE